MRDDAGLLRRYADERAQDAFAEIVRRHLAANVARRSAGHHGTTRRKNRRDARACRARSDAERPAVAQGGRGRPGLHRTASRGEAEFEATLRDVLGPENWSQYREFHRMAPARKVITEVAATATFNRVPLTPAQGEQLMRVMAQASSAYGRGGPTDLTTINWDVVDAQAQQVLSPAQCALLTRSRVRCEAQLDDAIARALKADARTAPAQDGGPRR